VALFALGAFGLALLYFGTPELLGIRLYTHPMFLSALFMLVGYQLIFFSFFARIYAIVHLGDESAFVKKLFRYITIERASVVGGIAVLVGIVVYGVILADWFRNGFGALGEAKSALVALVFISLGIQTVFSAFMLSILGIKER